ncbi:MAG: RluA family pseudouridine synthase [Pseudomonadales bacterium]|nr:RluA family pseudouridine synthase [Pseudomonadales bacterium]
MSKETSPVGVSFMLVDINQVGQRLDNFLMSRLKGVPKSRIYRIIRKGEIRVNKKRVKPEHRLQQGDSVRIPPIRMAAANEVTAPSAQLLALVGASILYQDESLLILNKPSGLPVHAGTGVKTGLIEVLRYLYPENPDLELVHRLDKGTSGCIMVAKSGMALRFLNQELKAARISKVYHALVHGHWPRHISEVNAALYKNLPRSGERFVEVSDFGKSALTRFRILEELPDFTLMEARPVTGRTHQIRVHAQLIGHPILGDEKYGDPAVNARLKKQGISRLCLHAAELRLKHPLSGDNIEVRAPYDLQLENALAIAGSARPEA